MTSTTKEIIEKYISLIEADKWDEFFETIQNIWIPQSVRNVVQTLEECEIDPMPYLSFIPEGYYCCSPQSKAYIPSNITRICYKAFYASDIEEITIPNSVIEVEEGAFEACDFLKHVLFAEGTKYIQNLAFFECDALVNVTLPKSLVKIGHNVFNGCDNLTDVTYNGTREQWNKIINREFINEGGIIRYIHCVDGDIEL